MDLIKTSFGMQSTAKIVVAGSVGTPMPPLAATPVELVMGNQKRLLSFFPLRPTSAGKTMGLPSIH
jgi:hypothetical protein